MLPNRDLKQLINFTETYVPEDYVRCFTDVYIIIN